MEPDGDAWRQKGMAGVRSTVLAGVLALLALSACGSVEQAGRDPAAPVESTSTSTPTGTRTAPMPPTPTEPPEDLIVPPTHAGAKHSTVRVSGTVSDGVEPGCKLLTDKGVVYLLIWRQGTLVAGQTVEVVGTVQPDLITTCQQGTPLVVERILSQ